MATYTAPLKDMEFVLNEVIQVEQLSELEPFSEVSEEIRRGVLEEAAKLIETSIAPLNQQGDQQGCTWKDNQVTTPEGFTEAYKLYGEGGWIGLQLSPEFEGQGLPYTLATTVAEMLASANSSFCLYPGLSMGCYEAIEANGSDELKATYLSKIATGTWAGTMVLTESGAGSDVGLVSTKAQDSGDGSYQITGNKIFITGGEQDLTENIVHLVLARLPGSPEGIRGISMFVVPKFLPDADGNPGERNPVFCTAIEHKMGLNGSATCALAFEQAKGFLVGEVNQGIQNMFVMMNNARLMVGTQGLGICELSKQNAILYAKERKQGRPLSRKAESTSDNVSIIGHPDVRRMLMTMKAYTEGSRMLSYDTAKHVDLMRHHPDAEVRQQAAGFVDLMTPICKGFFTDLGVEMTSMGVQVLGGHGYIAEHGMEQMMRDSKIFCLYEGTNGIQALDLIGRKLNSKGGLLANRFFEQVEQEMNQLSSNSDLDFVSQPVVEALSVLKETTDWMRNQSKTNPDDPAAVCCDYARMFALVTVGYYWAKAAAAAQGKDDAFYTSKTETARFYVSRLLPNIYGLAKAIPVSSDPLMALGEENFS